MKIEEKQVSGFRTKMVSLNNIVIGIAIDIGPRIIYAAGEERPDFNLFGVLPEVGIATPEGFWRIYGGHRLWSSPEAKPRSYSMDDKPVKIDVAEDIITIRGNPESENSIQKEIAIEPFSENGVQVVHSIKNIGRWPTQLACWPLSVMRQNGFAIIPLKPSKVDEEGLLPDRHVSFWPFTDLPDERLTFSGQYIFVNQNPEIKNPLKIGTMPNPAWAAYWVDGMAFVKQFSREEGEYPDFGCGVEVYTNADMLELETVGPLRTVDPSEHICHTEVWKIFDVEKLSPTGDSVRKNLEVLLSE